MPLNGEALRRMGEPGSAFISRRFGGLGGATRKLLIAGAHLKQLIQSNSRMNFSPGVRPGVIERSADRPQPLRIAMPARLRLSHVA
jgi:hypothetical protein